MKYILLFIVILFTFFSCTQRELNSKGDLDLVKKNYQTKFKEAKTVLLQDSANFESQNKMFFRMKFTFNNTIPRNAAQFSTESEKKDAAFSAIKDTLERTYFYDVLEMPKLHPGLFNGKITIQDPDNLYILAYTSCNDNEALLTILNMDEDNRAFKADFDFPNLDLLLCNYDVYLSPPPINSLCLRPYEARIYKIK
jgi:hypothetical protein